MLSIKARKTWTQKNGKAIPVRSLSDQHLENAARVLERDAEKLKAAAIQGLDAAVIAFGGWESGAASLDRQRIVIATKLPARVLLMANEVYRMLLAEMDRRKLPYAFAGQSRLSTGWVKKLIPQANEILKKGIETVDSK